MHYFEDKKHRIQADIALRIGKIAVQYSHLLLPPEQSFKDTLHLCLLQNLLTNCKELMEVMTLEGDEELGLKVPLLDLPNWGLNAVEIRKDSFEGSLTVEVLLIHLRNSMSHPTGTDLNAPFSSTGYNSIPDSSGMIGAIGFCNSPDTEKNRPRMWTNEKAANNYLQKCQRLSSKSPWCTIPSDVYIGQVGYNRFGMYRYDRQYRCDRQFAREFLVILTTEQLHSLVLNLSNLLAQPAIAQWDGKSIRNIVAA